LLEEVPLNETLSAKLQNLPPYSGGNTNGGGGLGGQASLYPGFPRKLPPQPALARNTGETIKVASQHAPAEPMLVLDYVTLNAAKTNFTFTGGETFLISNALSLIGSTTIEPSAVLKYVDDPSLYWGLDLYGPLICPSNIYSPAIFTSKDDNSVGAIIAGSTGSPVTATNVYYFFLDSTNIAGFSNCRFSYAAVGALILYSGELELQNCQFVNCAYGLVNRGANNLNLRNVLFAGGTKAIQFWQNAITLNAEHVTSTSATFWGYNDYQPVLHLTNSIIYGFSAPSGYAAQTYAATNPVGTVFQSVAGGNFYLANYSPFREVATPVISPSAKALVAAGTTFPPILLTNNFTSNTTLYPQAPRDVYSRDYGYHYPPLDFVISNRSISGATLTLTNGVAVGVLGTNGLTFSTSSPGLVSQGSPLNLNRLVPCAAVQELVTNRLNTLLNLPGSGVASIDLRFTALPLLGGISYFLNLTDPDPIHTTLARSNSAIAS
jgi:hypothetical protein